MLRIDGEWKRQGRLRLRVAHGQLRGQNASSAIYIYIYKAVDNLVVFGCLDNALRVCWGFTPCNTKIFGGA